MNPATLNVHLSYERLSYTILRHLDAFGRFLGGFHYYILDAK